LNIETAPIEVVTGPIVLEPPIPVLRITSMEAARDFYVNFLGFKFDWGDDGPQTKPAYAQVSRDADDDVAVRGL
jgi:hypothetical protein